MPHGEFKHSGYGKDLSMYGLEDYTRGHKRRTTRQDKNTFAAPGYNDGGYRGLAKKCPRK
jgi:hypothetical protein